MYKDKLSCLKKRQIDELINEFGSLGFDEASRSERAYFIIEGREEISPKFCIEIKVY